MAPLPPREPAPGHRDWYAFEALRTIPRLVLMVDKNQYSPTYGSFDRSYWHYRTMDFPCGMNQEFVLPLALAYKMDLPGNIYRGKERLRELALAGIDYARKSGHADGTTDDYFPFERALGALVFSLYAMTESCLELGETNNPAFLEFFTRRADWLLKHNETGQLANHQAFAALALYNVYLLTKDERFRKGSDAFRDLTLSWGHEEGWFAEYEGCDPGYHSCTIAFFAKLWLKSKDPVIFEALKKACVWARNFMHPDGSYAGEYGSRNTFHFYPHGFEVMAPHVREAGEIADSFLHRGMPNRTRYFNDDDRMAAHYVYDWMYAWRDYAPERTGPVDLPAETSRKYHPGARMAVVRTPKYHAVVNASKGGTFKAVSPAGAFAGDTGLIGKLAGGKVVVTHIVARNNVQWNEAEGSLRVEGVFQNRKSMLPTPFKQILFRVFMLTVGRFNANLVRSTLQKILIVQKAPLALKFRRTFQFADNQLRITDEVENPTGEAFISLSAGTDATSIYVANSNVFQQSVLLPWTDLPAAELETLNRTGRVTWTRNLEVDH